MVNYVGPGLLVDTPAAEHQVLLSLWAGGPVLLLYQGAADMGTPITNPRAVQSLQPGYICALSGFTIRDGDETRKTWTGETVLARFWEPRHPQDFVRSRPETPLTTTAIGQPRDRFIGEDVPQVTYVPPPVVVVVGDTLQLGDLEYVTLSDGSRIEVYA